MARHIIVAQVTKGAYLRAFHACVSFVNDERIENEAILKILKRASFYLFRFAKSHVDLTCVDIEKCNSFV